MNSSQNVFETIEKYLNGDLSDGERLEFESNIQTDPDLADEVEAHRIANDLITDYNLLKIREGIPDWHKENDSKSGFTKSLLGLSVVAIMMISALVFQEWDREKLNDNRATFLKDKTEHIGNTASIIQDQKIEKIDAEEPLIIQQDGDVAESLADPVNNRLMISDIHEISRKDISTPKILNWAPEVISSKTKDCSKTLTADFFSFQGSCEGELGGFIKFSNKAINGQNPVAFSIDGGETYQRSRSFEFLENGKYYMKVQVVNGCFHEYPESIILKPNPNCDNSEVFVIDLSQNQHWEPKLNLSNAKIEIRNSNGGLVFSSSFDNQFRWYGQNRSGETLPMGEYFYTIKSSSNSLKSGSVTLLK